VGVWGGLVGCVLGSYGTILHMRLVVGKLLILEKGLLWKKTIRGSVKEPATNPLTFTDYRLGEKIGGLI